MNIHVPGVGSQSIPPAASNAEGRLHDWRAGLPALSSERVSLRELQVADASNLYSELSSPEAKKFMWAPPPNVVAFERFIEWTHAERHSGKYICYGVVPQGKKEAWGVFELRQLQPGFLRGELGFVIAPAYWGTGVFYEAAQLMLKFAFETVNVHRIEARAAVDNDRSNAALQKIGASREGTLKDAFWRDDHFVDQYLWALLDSDWRSGLATAAVPGSGSPTT